MYFRKLPRKLLSLITLSAFILGMFLLPLVSGNIPVAKAQSQSSKNLVFIDPTTQYQEIEGWGTSLAWWANMVGGWDMPGRTGREARQELMDLIFDTEKGLGINIVRYNIGGGDNPEHDHYRRIEGDIPGFKKYPDSPYDWDADANQIWVLKQAQRIQGDDLIVEAFSNSPPWYMTVSGCNSGHTDASKDNLRPEYYDAFAEYLVDVTEYFKNNLGITFDYLEPLNEPASSYWGAYSTKQEGCHFDQGESQSKIILKVYEELVKRGLEDEVKLTGTDETSIDVQIESIKKLSPEALDKIIKINPHTYGGSKRYEIKDLSDTLNKKLWMSEFCTGSGPDDHESMTSALDLGSMILRDLRDMQCTAWVVWQAVESEVENQLWNNNYGLIHGVYPTAEQLYEDYHIRNGMTRERYYELGLERGRYFLTKQYYVFGQYSKFIRPGYTMIDINSPDAVAAISPEKDKLVIVVQNSTNVSRDYTFYLDNFDITNKNVEVYRTSETEKLAQIDGVTVVGNMINDVLPEKSVTTYIVDAKYTKGSGTIVNDNVLRLDDEPEATNKMFYSSTEDKSDWQYSNQPGAYHNDIHYSNIEGAYYELSFEGTGIELYGSISPDGGIAQIIIDGKEVAAIDTYSPNREEQILLWRTNDLEDGKHNIKVVVTGEKNEKSADCVVVNDKVRILKGDVSRENKTPIIISAKGWNERAVINFIPVEGADSHKIKIGTSPGEYDRVITDITGNAAIIDNLEPNNTYYVAATAVINGAETEESEEYAFTTVLPNTSGTFYYVDCGDSTPDIIDEPDEEFGLFNSLEDQEYGIDPASGYKWGYTSTGGTWANGGTEDKFVSLRCDTSDQAYGHITYKFEVPEGEYRVILGFYDPWNNSRRSMDIILEDEMKEKGYITPSGKKDIKIYEDIQVVDGELDVKVRRSDSAGARGDLDPHISWIIVQPMSVKSIVSVEQPEPAVTITGQEPALQQFIEVTYADGTTETKAIDWEEVDPEKYDEDYEESTIKGVVAGTNIAVETSLFTVPEDLIYFVDAAGQPATAVEFNKVAQLLPGINQVPDQLYEEGKTDWGYLEADAGTYDHSDKYNSVRWARSDRDITYKLAVPNGTYEVVLGFFDPWGVTRDSDIYFEDIAFDKGVTITPERMMKEYKGINVKDGVLDLCIKASPGSGDPILSFILVRPGEEQTVIPISAEEPAPVLSLVGERPVLPDRVSVNMSDGSKRLMRVDWADMGDYNTINTFEVQGTVEGTSITTKVFVKIVPENLVYYVDCGTTKLITDFTTAADGFSLYNDAPDQELTEGKTWGYTAYSQTGAYWENDTDPFWSVRVFYGDSARYDFDLPNGTYDIYIGILDPWYTSNSNRKISLTVEGEKLRDELGYKEKKIELLKDIEVNDGQLNLEFGKVADDICISWIMIASTQDTTKPFIRGAYDIEVELGSDFDPLDGVVAVDNEDGDITENIKIEGDVDTSKEGLYTLKYIVEDNAGNVKEIIRQVNVVEEGVAKPVSVQPTRGVCTAIGKKPILPTKVAVNMSDGTTSLMEVEWNSINAELYESINIFTVKGKVKDTNLETSILVKVVPDRLVYYVDSGGDLENSDFQLVANKFWLLNSLPDQKHGQDSETGYEWGYIGDSGVYGSENYFNSVRYANEDTLKYNFQLPAGYYDVYIGFYDPWNNGWPVPRVVNVILEDELVDERVTVIREENTREYQNVKVTDGELNIDLQLPQGTNEKPVISWIMITLKSSDVTPPVLLGIDDKTIEVGMEFDPMEGVQVRDNSDINLRDKVTVEGHVNTSIPGVYILTYKVSDSSGNTIEAVRTIRVVDTLGPEIIGAVDKTIYVGEEFDPFEGVTAIDNVDGDITSKIQVNGTVDISKPGEYQLVYTVEDSSGNVAEVIRTITVIEKSEEPEEPVDPEPEDPEVPEEPEEPGDDQDPGDDDKPVDEEGPGDDEEPGDQEDPGDDKEPGDQEEPSGEDKEPGDQEEPSDEDEEPEVPEDPEPKEPTEDKDDKTVDDESETKTGDMGIVIYIVLAMVALAGGAALYIKTYVNHKLTR